MDIKTDKKRLNVYLDPEQKVFVERESKRLGITQTALMSIALEQYKERRMTMDVLPQFMQAIEQLQDVERLREKVASKISKPEQLAMLTTK